MSIELKIKSKHLALEAQVIRFEERKLKKQIRHNLGKESLPELVAKLQSISLHRKWNVRNENRATFLARAFIEGKQYNQVEQKRRPEFELSFQVSIIPRVVTLVQRYGKRGMNVTRDTIVLWSKL
jgi:hypothetical protein